jgi:hypothetical protein
LNDEFIIAELYSQDSGQKWLNSLANNHFYQNIEINSREKLQVTKTPTNQSTTDEQISK